MSGAAYLLTLTLLASASPGDEETARRAEAAFAEGVRLREQPAAARAKFREAADLYETLHRHGHRNADLYRSQGNALMLAGDLSGAILAYRRGLRLDPNDRGLAEGLQAARDRVQYPPGGPGRPPTDDRPPWLPHLTLTVWTTTVLFLCYALCCVGLLRWRMTRSAKWLWSSVAGLLLVGGSAVVLTRAALEDERQRQSPLVVVADDGVLLFRGNGYSYPKHEVPLSRGTEARLRHERDGWVQIELTGGTVGWVPREYVLIDRDD